MALEHLEERGVVPVRPWRAGTTRLRCLARLLLAQLRSVAVRRLARERLARGSQRGVHGCRLSYRIAGREEGIMSIGRRILIMGASYGSLLATKLLLAGHTVKLAGLPAEAELINREGTRVRLPVKGRDSLVEIDSRQLPGKLSADMPSAIDPAGFDLVALAMQEPQYRSPRVRELLHPVAQAKRPCMSIMNMPPPPFLARIAGLAAHAYPP